MKKRLFLANIAAVVLFAPATNAQVLEDEPRHPEIFDFNTLVAAINGGAKLYDLRVMGLSVFATPFNNHDGLGDGPFVQAEWDEDPIAFGHRPTLQGNGTFLRVNGLDAQSCNECHTIESNRTNPPRLGVAGIGGAVQNAIIMASLIDVGDSSDLRVNQLDPNAIVNPELPLMADGVADYNGRFSNPPFLYGGGGVELLAKEMTDDLQLLLEQARAATAGTVIQLDTHGVNFGYIVSNGGGAVDLGNVEGIGPEHIASVSPEEALVVRPFGRKGENFSMRDFDRGAMQFHFGVQPVEVVGAGIDEDGDGVVDEVTEAEMSVLHIFDTTNARPRMDTLDATAQAGFANFTTVGCVQCHMPMLETYDTLLPLAHPEYATDPFDTAGNGTIYFWVDLNKDVGSNTSEVFELSPNGGVYVPLFSDLKRHYMGPGLAETFERGELANGEFITARLWGIADTGPYLHDGRATTLHQAIMQHGGEAEPVRLAYEALDVAEQSELISFLLKLKVPEGANADLAKTLIKQ